MILSDAYPFAPERHSEDMGRYDFFDHDAVESSLFSAAFKLRIGCPVRPYAYPSSYTAKNLAVGYETATQGLRA